MIEFFHDFCPAHRELVIEKLRNIIRFHQLPVIFRRFLRHYESLGVFTIF